MRKRSTDERLHVHWVDRGRVATLPANPEYPDGIDIDMTGGDRHIKSCKTSLPYPAKRCGYYVVTCPRCGMKVIVTTAGRTDDPKSARITCKRRANA